MAVGLLTVLNGHLDTGRQMPHVVTVQDKHRSHSRHRDTHYIEFPSWRAGHRMEEIVVGRGFYSRVEEGESTLRVVTVPGRYGFEWVVDYHLQP